MQPFKGHANSAAVAIKHGESKIEFQDAKAIIDILKVGGLSQKSRIDETRKYSGPEAWDLGHFSKSSLSYQMQNKLVVCQNHSPSGNVYHNNIFSPLEGGGECLTPNKD